MKVWLCVLVLVVAVAWAEAMSLGGEESAEGPGELTEAELAGLLARLRPSKRNSAVWKRGCLLNAGLSQGCDLSDYLSAKAANRKFSSFAGPGKR